MSFLHIELLVMVEHMCSVYSTTSLLTIMYNAGALALAMYMIQVVSGIMMVMMYAAEESAFLLLDVYH